MFSKIEFLLSTFDKRRLEIVKSSDEFEALSGIVDVKIGGINLSECQDGTRFMNEDRIIEFAFDWISSLQEIIEGEEALIEHGESNRKFIFRKDGDFISCSAFDGYNNRYIHENVKYPVKNYCRDLLVAVKKLDELIKINPKAEQFYMYNILSEDIDRAVNVVLQNDILSKSEVDSIFEDKKIGLPEK